MIKITIKDLRGNTHEINVEDSANVSKIKSLITKKEELPPKLIFNGILLNDEDNLKNRKISNGSTLIKIERRRQKENKKEESATLNTIKEATSQYNKEGQETDDMTVSKNMVEDVQKKLENLIHSFFGGQEGTNNNNNNVNSPNNQQSNSEPEPEIPVPEVELDSLENLMSMGFPEVACKKALIFTNGNCEEALEWILQHSEDNDFNEPITQRQLKGLGLGAKPGNKRRNENEFVPHPLAFQRLTEMGFDENQVTEALRATNNDEQSAAAYLLGDGIEGGERGGMRGGMGIEGMEEFDDLEDNPLLLQNPLIRALLQNPAVQSGMTNPRVIQAFQRIMENPQSAGEYLRDPLIGPILMQVNSIISNHQPNDPPNNNNPVNNNPNDNNNPPNTPNTNNNNDNNNNLNNLNNPNNNQQNNNTPLNINNPLQQTLPQDNNANNNNNNNNNLNLNQNLFNNAVNLLNNFNQLNNLFYDDDDDEEGEDLDENEDLDEDEDDMNFD